MKRLSELQSVYQGPGNRGSDTNSILILQNEEVKNGYKRDKGEGGAE